MAGAELPEKPTFVKYLRDSAVPRDVIDGFLRGPSWARFDPELGLFHRSLQPEGEPLLRLLNQAESCGVARPEADHLPAIRTGFGRFAWLLVWPS
jgi:hypothetical protein